MTDNNTPASLDVRRRKSSGFGAVSWIWLVPIIALGVILSATYQTYQDRGVAIEIAFGNGAGISKDTPIRYRDIDIGYVEKITFSSDLENVVATARVDQNIAPFLDEGAQFWVVEPDVSLRGVSGLDTVLAGVYIAGRWDTVAGEARTSFEGLDTAPLLAGNERGVEIVLRTDDGRSIAKGAPLLHKGLQVGFLDEPQLDPLGLGVTVAGFVEAEYADLVTTNTRFWDTSGFSFTVGANGLGLNVDSIASLIEGGIAFDTVVSGGIPVSMSPDPFVFEVYDNETDARESLFENEDQTLLTVGILFDENINGLTVGSGVKYQGVRVGEVSAINAIVVEEGNSRSIKLRTILELSPGRIGIAEGTSEEDSMFILAGFVANGMRARLVTGNILTGSLEVELVDVENTEFAFLDTDQDPFPIIPTTASDVSDVADTAEGVLARINELPIEDLMQGAIDLMASINALAQDDSLQAAPEQLLGVLAEARTFIASEDLQNTPDAIQTTLDQIDLMTAQLTELLTGIEEANVVGNLSTTLSSADDAVKTINSVAGEVPAVLEQIAALTEKANALQLEVLINQATTALSEIEALIASESIAALPDGANETIAQIQGILSEIQTGGAVANLNTTLESANAAAESVAASVEGLPAITARANELLDQLQAAADDLPQITAGIEDLVAKANAVEIDALMAQAEETLESIDMLVRNDATQALPGNVNASLAELEALLSEVRAGGAIENVNATLAAASEAAQALEEAAEGLPALSSQTGQLIANINAVANVYGERGRFTADTNATLRDIQEAADAITSLARAIQRNPSSILTGR